jgi:acid phosphatase
LSDAKKSVYDYYISGKYEKDINVAVDEALHLLNYMSIPSNPVVVFDIDETALSSWSYQVKNNYGYNESIWNIWVDSANAKAIPGVKRLYDSLIKKNIGIIFLTGRKHSQYKKTIENLEKEGYTKFVTLICRTPDLEDINALQYKSNVRKELSKKYNIIGSVGDQWSDLNGGWTILKVKIPNYIYIIE